MDTPVLKYHKPIREKMFSSREKRGKRSQERGRKERVGRKKEPENMKDEVDVEYFLILTFMWGVEHSSIP
jgi:hypothetical protein